MNPAFLGNQFIRRLVPPSSNEKGDQVTKRGLVFRFCTCCTSNGTGSYYSSLERSFDANRKCVSGKQSCFPPRIALVVPYFQIDVKKSLDLVIIHSSPPPPMEMEVAARTIPATLRPVSWILCSTSSVGWLVLVLPEMDSWIGGCVRNRSTMRPTARSS